MTIFPPVHFALLKLVQQLIDPLTRNQKIEIIYEEKEGEEPLKIQALKPQTVEEKKSLEFKFPVGEQNMDRFKNFKKDLIYLLNKKNVFPTIIEEQTENKLDTKRVTF